jgi:hypothetical protein
MSVAIRIDDELYAEAKTERRGGMSHGALAGSLLGQDRKGRS